MERPSMIKITRDAIRNDPREIFNWWTLACTWIWSFAGVAKGFDEGESLAQLQTCCKTLTPIQETSHRP
jgi:hypothetical protein